MNRASSDGAVVSFCRGDQPQAGRLFRIHVEKLDGSKLDLTERCADSVDATHYGMEVGNDPLARVEVRPL